MFIAPIAGALSDRISPTLILGTGLTLQAVALAWIGLVSTPTVAVLVARRPVRARRGRDGALLRAGRERRPLVRAAIARRARPRAPTTRSASSGGVFGVAVLASVFSHVGGYESGQAFTDGTSTAVLVGAAVVGVGALAAFAMPGRLRRGEVPVEAAEPLARQPEPGSARASAGRSRGAGERGERCRRPAPSQPRGARRTRRAGATPPTDRPTNARRADIAASSRPSAASRRPAAGAGSPGYAPARWPGRRP